MPMATIRNVQAGVGRDPGIVDRGKGFRNAESVFVEPKREIRDPLNQDERMIILQRGFSNTL
jgi:hypothetical protein